jgi:mono/diheme cytochrome c family protein
MPTLGLSEAEVASLIAFLTEQDSGGAQPVAPQPISATPGEGSAAIGKNLFTGVTRLSNGGPSCRACHSSSGIGGLGGGKLGPDLTFAYETLGDAMILWPETSQTMKPIFTSKPLTDQEKVDLLAFFSSTDVTKRPTEVIWQLVGLAVVGVAVMAVPAQLIWRGRLRGVRIPMVSRER